MSQKKIQSILDQIAKYKENIHPEELQEIIFHTTYPKIPRCKYYPPDHLFETYFELKFWWDRVMGNKYLKCPLVIIADRVHKPLEFATSLVNHPSFYLIVESMNKRKYTKRLPKFVIFDNVKYQEKHRQTWINVIQGKFILGKLIPSIIIFDTFAEFGKMLADTKLNPFLISLAFVLLANTNLAPQETAPCTLEDEEDN